MRLPWARPSWKAEAERWIRERLAEVGRSVDSIEQPHVRPWGTVFRVQTDDRVLWFKASIAQLAYEVPLLETLATRAPEHVPRLVAADPARAWMLIEDAGTRLTDLHPDGPPAPVWKDFMRDYAELQIDVAHAASDLIAEGVPDRRLPLLVDGFLRVLQTARLVRPAAGKGLTDDDLCRARSLEPRLRDAVDIVGVLGLPDSIQHDDLHAWNVCLSDGAYRFIDWGDACIGQPLLSLYVPLVHVGDEGATEVRDAYLERWTAFRTRAELAAACDAAVMLGQLTGMLKWELITAGLTDEERRGYEDVIPKRVRYLLELACA